MLKSRASKYGVEIIEVDPAYTSIIGEIKFMKRYGLSTHALAACVIARRGLGLSIEQPKYDSILGDFSKFNNSKPLKSRWAGVAYSIKKDLFLTLFRGRENVCAKRWRNKPGYSPFCFNDFKTGICNKPRIKCTECKNSRFAPLNSEQLKKHLMGEEVLGLYPMTEKDTCYLLVIDLDEARWQDDSNVIRKVCVENKIPVYVERSRSGQGCHIVLSVKKKELINKLEFVGLQLMVDIIQCSNGCNATAISDRISLLKRKAVSVMNIADRIQSLPDIEKIILLSDYFGVTTDYLLKGIEPMPDIPKKKVDARIFFTVGSVFNFIGLIVAIIIWEEKQTSVSVAVGPILMAFGCMIF